MSSKKITTAHALFAAREASYNAGSGMSGTNAVQILLPDRPVFNLQYATDGNRNGGQMSRGNIPRAGVGGRTTTATVKFEMKGLGSAYGSSSVPPNITPFLYSAGLTGSLSASGWLFTPQPPTTTLTNSMALAVYDMGELLSVSGAYSNMKIVCSGPMPSEISFDVQGVASAITDVAIESIPTPTWTANTVIPPKNEGTALTITSASVVYASASVRSYEFDNGQEIQPRLNINAAAGHSGFALGRRSPTVTMVIEADQIANFDPYTIWSRGDTVAIEFTVGAIQYNRYRISFPQASIVNVEKQADGAVALWSIQFAPAISTPSTNDDYSIYFF